MVAAGAGGTQAPAPMTIGALCRRHRFPREVIARVVWLHARFPLSLRMVEEMLLERGIDVSHETIRCWGMKFGPALARGLRRRAPRPGDVWHRDEVWVAIRGRAHWLWRAVDQHGVVLDEVLQRRRDERAARRPLVRLLRRQGWRPRRVVTDKLASYAAATRELAPTLEHTGRTEGSTTAPRTATCRSESASARCRASARREACSASSRPSPPRATCSPRPPARRRSALATRLHRLEALGEWRRVAGLGA